MRKNGCRQELAESAKKLIEENYAEKFSMKELSESLYVAESYLHRTFREQTGMTPLQYHHIVRCEKAKELLLGTDLSVAMVAWKVGFQNESHFSRIFNKVTGSTPSVYRKENRKYK